MPASKQRFLKLRRITPDKSASIRRRHARSTWRYRALHVEVLPSGPDVAARLGPKLIHYRNNTSLDMPARSLQKLSIGEEKAK